MNSLEATDTSLASLEEAVASALEGEVVDGSFPHWFERPDPSEVKQLSARPRTDR